MPGVSAMFWEAGGLGEETGKQLKDIGSPSSVDSRREKKQNRREREGGREGEGNIPKGLNGSQIAVTAFRVWSRGLIVGQRIRQKLMHGGINGIRMHVV